MVSMAGLHCPALWGEKPQKRSRKSRRKAATQVVVSGIGPKSLFSSDDVKTFIAAIAEDTRAGAQILSHL